jgi:hypothetical protein
LEGDAMTGTERQAWMDEEFRAVVREFSDSGSRPNVGSVPLSGCRVLVEREGSGTAVLAEAVAIGHSCLVFRGRSALSVDDLVTVRWTETRAEIAPVRLRVVATAADEDGSLLVRGELAARPE